MAHKYEDNLKISNQKRNNNWTKIEIFPLYLLFNSGNQNGGAQYGGKSARQQSQYGGHSKVEQRSPPITYNQVH